MTNLNPFRTAVPFWGQTSQIPSSLSPKRDWGSKRVKLATKHPTITVRSSCFCNTSGRHLSPPEWMEGVKPSQGINYALVAGPQWHPPAFVFFPSALLSLCFMMFAGFSLFFSFLFLLFGVGSGSTIGPKWETHFALALYFPDTNTPPKVEQLKAALAELDADRDRLQVTRSTSDEVSKIDFTLPVLYFLLFCCFAFHLFFFLLDRFFTFTFAMFVI